MLFGIPEIWNPFEKYGLNGSFYEINVELLFNAFCAGLILIIAAIFAKRHLKRKKNSKVKMLLTEFGEAIYNLIDETLGYVNKASFSFVATLFTILLAYNLIVLIPHLEEPTKNINVTIAFALFSFCFIHYFSFRERGVSYLEHWFKMPLSIKKENLFMSKSKCYPIEMILRATINLITAIILLPFEMLSRCAIIMSLSFRLFGNIFGGAKISELFHAFLKKSLLFRIVGSFSMINLLLMGFFGCFEGFMQAFIFTLISLNNIGILLGDKFLEKKQQEVKAI
jgi:F-type H+-transporting ATPase subunit a